MRNTDAAKIIGALDILVRHLSSVTQDPASRIEHPFFGLTRRFKTVDLRNFFALTERMTDDG